MKAKKKITTIKTSFGCELMHMIANLEKIVKIVDSASSLFNFSTLKGQNFETAEK